MHFEHALDHEHDVGAARVVLVKHKGGIRLKRPGQDAFPEFRDLLPIADDDGVLAHEVDAAHMAVEVDADAGPVQPRRHLLDMGRFTGAVIALDHDAPVVGEAGQDRERRVSIEKIVGIEFRHILARLRIGWNLHGGIDAEHLPDGHIHVGQASPHRFTV